MIAMVPDKTVNIRMSSSTRMTRWHGLRLDCKVGTNTLPRVQWSRAAAGDGQMWDTETQTLIIICIDDSETFSEKSLMEA